MANPVGTAELLLHMLCRSIVLYTHIWGPDEISVGNGIALRALEARFNSS